MSSTKRAGSPLPPEDEAPTKKKSHHSDSATETMSDSETNETLEEGGLERLMSMSTNSSQPPPNATTVLREPAVLTTALIAVRRMNQPRIDANSFHVVCDYFTLPELAATIGRINHSWLHLLSSYRPSAGHPFRRQMKVPTSEDEDLPPIGYHSEMAKERQWWMQQDTLPALSKAAPVYRRMISTMILDPRPHGDVYYSAVPSTIISSSTLQLLSNKEAFPNLRTLYCTFSGMMEYQRMNHRWRSVIKSIDDLSCSSDHRWEVFLEEHDPEYVYAGQLQDLTVFPPYEHFSSDELRLQDLASINPDTGRHRYDWSLPSQLHTLDCTVQSLEGMDKDVSGLIYLFQRIGECRTLKRLSIHFSHPWSHPRWSIQKALPEVSEAILVAVSKLVDLIELELVCFNFDPFFYDSAEMEKMSAFYQSFPNITALRPWLFSPPHERLDVLFAHPFPIHQLRCIPHIKSANVKVDIGTRLITVHGLKVTDDDVLKGLWRKMCGLRQFAGLVESPTTDLFTSLTGLTHLEVYCLKPNTWNSQLIESLTHSQLLTKLVIILLTSHSVLHGFVHQTVPISSAIDPVTEDGLGRLFASLLQLEHLSIRVNHDHEFFIQSIGPKYAPHLHTTLKTLELVCGTLPLMDLQHLTSLTRLRLKSFTASKDEFIQVFNSFTALTSCDLTQDPIFPDTKFYESMMMCTNVVHQLRQCCVNGYGLVWQDNEDVPPLFFQAFHSLESFKCFKQVQRLSTMTGLTSLKVSGLDGHVIDVDLLVSSLQQSRPRLRSLKLIRLMDFNDQHLSQVIQLVSTTLKRLELEELPLLTDLSTLSTISTRVVKLSLINLSGLHSSTMTLISRLKYLESLIITLCPTLPESTYQLITTMKHLTSLDLDSELIDAIIKSGDTSSMSGRSSENPLYELLPELNLIKSVGSYFPSRFLTMDLCEACIQRHPLWYPPQSYWD